jgi:hypothetical protein
LQKVVEAAAGAPPDDGQEAGTTLMAPELTRIQTIESEMKRLRQEQEGGSVKSALSQVRTLALRSSTPNGVLLAALEQLHDIAVVADHPDKDAYKMAMKACRDNDGSGQLHGLVTRLLGTDSAKKAQTAVDSWKKYLKKAEKEKQDKDRESVKDDKKQKGKETNLFDQVIPLLFQSFLPSRGRGRGRPFQRSGQSSVRTCYVCRSSDHLMSGCPLNPRNSADQNKLAIQK